MKFRQLSLAHFINICGTQVSLIAIPWLFSSGGGLLGASFLFFVRLLPDVIVAPFASQAAFQRWAPQRIIVYSLGFQFFLGLGIWASAMAQFSLLFIALLMFFQGCVRYLVIGARYQLLNDLFENPKDIASATATLQILQQVGTIAGPGLGLVFLKYLHLPEVHLLLVDAVSFVLAALPLARFERNESLGSKLPQRKDVQFEQTFGFLASRKDLLMILASGLSINLVYFGFMHVIFPGNILRGLGLGSAFYSELLTLQGIGALLGGFACHQFLKGAPPKKMFLFSVFGLALCFSLLVGSANPLFMKAVYPLMGGLLTILMIKLSIIWQTNVPKKSIGAYMATINSAIVSTVLVSYMGMPLLFNYSVTLFSVFAVFCLVLAFGFAIFGNLGGWKTSSVPVSRE